MFQKQEVLGEVGGPVDLDRSGGGGGEVASLCRGAQAKPQLTLQNVADGPGGLSTRKAGVGASEAWKGRGSPTGRLSVPPLPPSNPDTGVHPLPLNLQVSCSSRLRRSQSQGEKTEEVPRTHPLHPHPQPLPTPQPKGPQRNHHLGGGGGRKVL